jgi:hypothetical protein
VSITSQLASAQFYALNSYSGITNVGSSVISGGNIGAFPTSSITGFPPGVVLAPFGIDNADSLQARLDALSAYNTFAAQSFPNSIANAGNLSVSGNGSTASTYLPGNYVAAVSSLDIPTSITLDAQGNSAAVFIFKTNGASTIKLESGASVLLVNGAQAANVVWLVGSSFTSIYDGLNSVMVGNILAQASITLGGGILNGRALAGLNNSSGAITIAASEAITVPPSGAPGPGPIPPGVSPSVQCLLSRNLGSSVLTAWPQVTFDGGVSKFLDLIQIVDEGGITVLNLSYNGTVNYPAVNPTPGTRIGVYYTKLNGSATLAAVVADTWKNWDQEDIIQVINVGGNISYFWNWLGIAYGS